jgi:hypothetical protein
MFSVTKYKEAHDSFHRLPPPIEIRDDKNITDVTLHDFYMYNFWNGEVPTCTKMAQAI